MRHYDRAEFRHLDDAERYRDYDYMADDGWIGPNERAPYGYTRGEGPPWSTAGEWETRPFARAVPRERPEERGRARGRGPREERPETGGFLGAVLHPARTMRRVVRGIFSGRGPKNWTRSDERLHDEVCDRLAHDSHVDATDIEVTVQAGEVTLAGTVPDRRTKRLAEEILDDVLGVKDVHNRLRVVAPR